MAYVPEIGEVGYAVDMEKLKTYSFEIGSMRPPSEGRSFSLLLRVTRNCPWNRCAFCYGTPYNHERFEMRSVEEIKADIESVKVISNEMKELPWQLGYAGRIELLGTVIQSNLFYGKGVRDLADDKLSNLYCAILVEVISYLKEAFASTERVTSYARSKTIVKKKTEELSQLHQAGLSRLHIGLETGDDELLSYINKGVTAEEHILAGRKALEAGFELSEYVMPGLGGKSRWVQHAKNTACVLNEINPHFISLRPFVPRYNRPMFEA